MPSQFLAGDEFRLMLNSLGKLQLTEVVGELTSKRATSWETVRVYKDSELDLTHQNSEDPAFSPLSSPDKLVHYAGGPEGSNSG